MEFVTFLGWFLSKIYNLLDFKIFDFPISFINILIGCFLFTSFIAFLKSISGVVGSTSSFDSASNSRNFFNNHSNSNKGGK